MNLKGCYTTGSYFNYWFEFEPPIQTLPLSLTLYWWFKFEPEVGSLAKYLKFINFGLSSTLTAF